MKRGKTMKKILIALTMLLVLSGCQESKIESDEPKEPSVRADMSGYSLLSDKEHVFELISMAESVELIESGRNVILYYGYTSCPWCQAAVPVLNEAAKEKEAVVYYVDLHASSEDPDVQLAEQEAFNELFVYMEPFLTKDATGQSSFYVPQVFIVKEGKIISGHTGTAPSAETPTMNDAQKKELKKIYTDMIKKIR